VVEHLLSMLEALGSYHKKKKQKERKYPESMEFKLSALLCPASLCHLYNFRFVAIIQKFNL
jgi:hypothetical protein